MPSGKMHDLGTLHKSPNVPRISHSSQHLHERSACLDAFHEMLGRVPLVYTDYYAQRFVKIPFTSTDPNKLDSLASLHKP